MRAFLAADSWPSLRRRPTSCSSWSGKGRSQSGPPTSRGPGRPKWGPGWKATLPVLLNLPGFTAGVNGQLKRGWWPRLPHSTVETCGQPGPSQSLSWAGVYGLGVRGNRNRGEESAKKSFGVKDGVRYLLQELLEVLGSDAAAAAQELRAERSVSRTLGPGH